jgi:hypothetical protein
MHARFDTEMAAINLILDRIDDRISKLEANSHDRQNWTIARAA